MSYNPEFVVGEEHGAEEVQKVIRSLPEGRFLAFAAKYDFPEKPGHPTHYSVQVGDKLTGITRRGASKTSLDDAVKEALENFDTIPFGADPFDVKQHELWIDIHGGKN